jgi:bla regulator protein BlaR1
MDQSFFQHISYAITYSIWNSILGGFLVFLILKLLLKSIPIKSASINYILSIGSQYFIFFIAINSFIGVFGEVPDSTINLENGYYIFPNHSSTIYHSVLIKDFFNWLNTAFLHLANYKNYFLGIWLIGLIYFFVKHLLTLISLKISCKNLFNENKKLKELLNDLKPKLNISRNIKIGEIQKLSSPIVFGVLKPTILFPIGLFTNLSTDQVEMILLHELAHLKRLDPIFKSIQTLIESLLFFNPFIWLISKEIEAERENACDDIVVKLSNKTITYSKALVKVSEYKNFQIEHGLAFISRKNMLLDRIKRIVSTNDNHSNINLLNICFSLLFSLIVTLSFFSMQEFEPFTVKSEKIERISSLNHALNLLEQSSEYSRELEESPFGIESLNTPPKMEEALSEFSETNFNFYNPYENFGQRYSSTNRFNFKEQLSLNKSSTIDLTKLEKHLEILQNNLNKITTKLNHGN